MATSAVQTELDEALGDIGEVKRTLEEAYRPEATREELAEAVGEALSALADGNRDRAGTGPKGDVLICTLHFCRHSSAHPCQRITFVFLPRTPRQLLSAEW